MCLEKSNIRCLSLTPVIIVPDIFRKDLSITEGFFDQLSSQPPNVKTYIQEALCTLLDAFLPLKDWANETEVKRILTIIEDNMAKVSIFSLISFQDRGKDNQVGTKVIQLALLFSSLTFFIYYYY